MTFHDLLLFYLDSDTVIEFEISQFSYLTIDLMIVDFGFDKFKLQ
jgi:hypothetical protein